MAQKSFLKAASLRLSIPSVSVCLERITGVRSFIVAFPMSVLGPPRPTDTIRLISKALHEIMPSREDVLRAVEEAIRALSDKGYLLDQILALTRTDGEGRRGKK